MMTNYLGFLLLWGRVGIRKLFRFFGTSVNFFNELMQKFLPALIMSIFAPTFHNRKVSLCARENFSQAENFSVRHQKTPPEIQSLCLRDKLFTPIFSTCTRMFDDVPKVETRISNLPSRLSDWVIRRTFSIVDSLSLRNGMPNQIKSLNKVVNQLKLT